MPRSTPRTTPPVTMTSQSGLSLRICATFKLLVMTRKPRCWRNSRATVSMVVPMFMISEQPWGTAAAMALAMRVLPSKDKAWRWR